TVMIRRMFVLFGLAAVLAAAATAQDPPRPKKAVVPETFRAYLVTDARFLPAKNTPIDRKGWTVQASTQLKGDDRDARDRTGKMHCLVCENGSSPVLAVFVRTDPKGLDQNSPVMKLTQEIEKLIPAYRGDKLAGFVMFLRLDGEYPADEMRDVVAQQIRDLSIATNATYVPFGLAPKQSPANTPWEHGEHAQVTAGRSNQPRVEKRWKFGADGPTPEQIKEIVAATEEAITGMKK